MPSKFLTVRYKDVYSTTTLKVSVIQQICLLNLTDEHNDDVDCVVIQPTEGVAEEPLDSTETCHETENVTGSISSRGASVENSVHMVASEVSERISLGNTSAGCPTPQYGLGTGVKRIRIPEQDADDAPSTSRLRTSENNGKS